MQDKIIKANVRIRNCPNDLEKYIVVRTDDSGNWFWGTYEDRLRAVEVARQVRGEVIERWGR